MMESGLMEKKKGKVNKNDLMALYIMENGIF
jgi:hypothetical protein